MAGAEWPVVMMQERCWGHTRVGTVEGPEGAGFQMCLEAECMLDMAFGEERRQGAPKVLT